MDRDSIGQQLFLALRQCATHPAGPLRAVAELRDAIECGRLAPDDARLLCEQALRRYRQQDPPEERMRTVELFLNTVADGASRPSTITPPAVGWDYLVQETAEARAAVVAHPVYERLAGIGQLRVFMEHHAFAVWDFMSLLTGLQRRLTCCATPWVPTPHDRAATRFINEIKLGEESDEHPDGGWVSHYEMYVEAMRLVGANTGPIHGTVEALRCGATEDPVEACVRAGAPRGATDFVASTFTLLTENRSIVEIAAAFAIGREQLIPAMFDEVLAVVPDGQGSLLRTYLERHVELDDEVHGPLTRRLLQQLCGDDPDAWGEAVAAALFSLEARRRLWDATLEAMPGHRIDVDQAAARLARIAPPRFRS